MSKISVQHLNLWYGEKHALKDTNLEIEENKITAFIGPSGCGKSTFLKTLNRMQDYVKGVRIEGLVSLDGEDIFGKGVDPTLLRKKVGMVLMFHSKLIMITLWHGWKRQILYWFVLTGKKA